MFCIRSFRIFPSSWARRGVTRTVRRLLGRWSRSFAVSANGASLAAGIEGLSAVPTIAYFIPKATAHLWFLHYLLYYYAGALLIAFLVKRLPEFVRRRCANGFAWLLDQPALRVILLGLITAATLLPVDGNLPLSNDFLPAALPLFFYFVFFLFGWYLYTHRGELQSFTIGAWTQTIAATSLTLVFAFVVRPKLDLPPEQLGALRSLIQGLSQWMFVFGITGLFIRYLDRPSARIRYIVDASYWVYLIHLPVAITASGLCSNSGLSVWLKMLFVIVITTLVGFVTYDWLVRNSLVGRILNGRQYPRGLPVPQSA